MRTWRRLDYGRSLFPVRPSEMRVLSNNKSSSQIECENWMDIAVDSDNNNGQGRSGQWRRGITRTLMRLGNLKAGPEYSAPPTSSLSHPVNTRFQLRRSYGSQSVSRQRGTVRRYEDLGSVAKPPYRPGVY